MMDKTVDQADIAHRSSSQKYVTILGQTDLIPIDLAEHRLRLQSRIQDDALLYDILSLSASTHLCYFAEPDAFRGGPVVRNNSLPPDEVMTSSQLLYHVHVRHDPAEDEIVDLSQLPTWVTVPFALAPLKNAPLRLPKDLIEQQLFRHRPIFLDSRHQKFLDRKIAERPVRHRHEPLRRNNLVLIDQSTVARRRDRLQSSGGRPVAVIAMHWLDTGGAETCAVEALKAAKQNGYDVICITDVRSRETLEHTARQYADHIFCLGRSLPNQYWREFIYRLFCRFHVDVFHIHHCRAAYEVLPTIKLFFPEVKVVSTTHIIEHGDGGYCRMSGVYSNYIDTHHVISEDLRSYYQDTFHVDPMQIRLGYLLDKKCEPSKIRRVPHSDIANHCKILFVGRMVQQKRPQLLVEIARQLKQRGLNFTITIVGTGPLKEFVEKFAIRRGVISHMKFLDELQHAQVLETIEDHHIMVIPSQNEGLTLVAYEASLRGCGIISTDVGAQREIVADVLLAPRQTMACIKKFVDSIGRIIRQPKFYERVMQEQEDKLLKLSEEPLYSDFLNELYSVEHAKRVAVVHE